MAALMEMHTSITGKQRNPLLNQIWLWGAISAIAACILGYMLSLGGGYNPEAVDIHKAFGISVATLSIICWLAFSIKSQLNKLLVLGLSGFQLLLLFTTGHYGANMTHGETYLVEHAPNFVRQIAGFEPHAAPREKVTSIAQADIYLDLIQPMFKQRCVSCHNDSKAKGGLNLASVDGIVKGGKTASTWGNGQLENSELYKRISIDKHDKKFMPAEGKTPLSDDQVDVIAWWIKAGTPTSGLVGPQKIADRYQGAMARVLGLSASAGAWPLAKIATPNPQIITSLNNQGFIVKQISQKVAHLDIDASIRVKNLPNSAIQTLVDNKTAIAYLNLSKTQVTDEQLVQIAQLSNLIKLRLDSTQVTSQGIAALAGASNLTYLNLYGTQVDDQVFSTLATFPKLKKVFLADTNISLKAANEFSEKHSEIALIHNKGLNKKPEQIAQTAAE
ncbi:c-type cytochrome domain-containing protein [Saccharobesus litoralis]|nr:c-type cytochrome domain-containing protein [Saccharobesus litoralis]